MAKKTSTKPKKVSPFTYISSLMQDDTNALETGKLPLLGMNRFMIVRGCMLHKETVLSAETANKLNMLPDDAIFDYLHYDIQPKRNRFAKFPRQKKASDEAPVYEYAEKYECSIQTAREALEFEVNE